MSTPEEAWSVQRLARTIKSRVEDGFPPVWVRGEVVGFKRYPSGHWYFGLRDELAKVDCVIWRSAAGRIDTPLTEGTEIFALGSPSVWEERTSLRFSITRVMPASAVGAAAQQLEVVRKRLAADGLFDPSRKRPLPAFPYRIAVVTSAAGAAVHDIITVARRRWPGIELVVVGAAVQGEQAPAELVRALAVVARLPGVELCIIGRGGGAREDLAAFNDEAVCRAIVACPVPVISAVGHEVDVTLADLVADLRAATPSQAAEFALPERREVIERVLQLGAGLERGVTDLLAGRRDRMQRTRERMGNALLGRLRTAERRLHRAGTALPTALAGRVRVPRERLDGIAARLKPAIDRRTARAAADLARLAATLDALSPLAVLGRGYAMARDGTGRVLRRRADFVPGSPFTLRVGDGDIDARVEES